MNTSVPDVEQIFDATTDVNAIYSLNYPLLLHHKAKKVGQARSTHCNCRRTDTITNVIYFVSYPRWLMFSHDKGNVINAVNAFKWS